MKYTLTVLLYLSTILICSSVLAQSNQDHKVTVYLKHIKALKNNGSPASEIANQQCEHQYNTLLGSPVNAVFTPEEQGKVDTIVVYQGVRVQMSQTGNKSTHNAIATNPPGLADVKEIFYKITNSYTDPEALISYLNRKDSRTQCVLSGF
ncbi:hypothetical protein [Candidiatus Paracoxiella cheracis]|uniref:hypothetical protein n=1 Tax=Candidiatus Paracoxiella cheracis TaxID=3405120 RepID=UPI003BF54B7B